jgi:hypothetical protein
MVPENPGPYGRVAAFVAWNVCALVAFVYATVAPWPARAAFLATFVLAIGAAGRWIREEVRRV